MKITNELGLPNALVAAVKNDPYNPGTCDISVTRLIAPARKVVLEAQHANEISEDVSDRLWALFGQAVHTVLERAEEGTLVEKRLTINRQGWKISGQFDRLVINDGVLQDYKITTTYSAKNGGRAEWEQQLNVLATILREHGYPVKQLEVIAILRDWTQSQVDRIVDYPVKPAMRIPVMLWPEEQCEEFIDERIRVHQAARTVLPECSAEERWERSGQWALMKAGRKTAVKLFDSESDAMTAAEAAGNGHCVEHRPGRWLRCEMYCPAARFCQKWQQFQVGPNGQPGD